MRKKKIKDLTIEEFCFLFLIMKKDSFDHFKNWNVCDFINGDLGETEIEVEENEAKKFQNKKRSSSISQRRKRDK